MGGGYHGYGGMPLICVLGEFLSILDKNGGAGVHPVPGSESGTFRLETQFKKH